MKYTGERVIPELMNPMNGMLLEHLARYHFAIHYAKGRVLDFATGSGYGLHIVAKAKKKDITEAIGIDNSDEAINYAKLYYYHPLVSHQVEDVTDRALPDKLGEFDTILSFETLEHIQDEEPFLRNIYQLLKPGGTLIISTPFGQGRGKPTKEPFHVHQLTKDEFEALFEQYSNVEYYYQRGVLIEPERENVYHPIGIAVCRK